MEESKYCWWKHGVIYQIYPLSFKDSNKDGYGDLKGLIEKISYLNYLGIEAIWLCPIHPSPWSDFGYDVSDYYDIHPKLGTLADFKELVKVCQTHRIKIIIDFVFNHTSTEHPWFKEASLSRTNPKEIGTFGTLEKVHRKRFPITGMQLLEEGPGNLIQEPKNTTCTPLIKPRLILIGATLK